MQYGRVSITTISVKNISFPLSFTKIPSFVAISNTSISSDGTSQGAWTESYCDSTSSAKVDIRGTSSITVGTVSWVAIGY